MSALSLIDAKAHLNLTTTANDVELQSFIDAAEALLGHIVGPLTVGSKTARVPGGPVVVLPYAPVQAITSMTSPDGTVVDTTSTTLNGPAGVLYFTDNQTRFASGAYDVTFTAGWTTVPADLLLAVKELVRHLWATQRGATARPGSSVDQAPGAAYALPIRVEQLIEPYRQPGIA